MNLEQMFPYSTFREGQRELAESVYDACKNGDRLVVEAMSGFGKTAPVLAGSLLAAGERGNRIIYACRTKRQVFRVMEELERIQKRVPAPATYLFSKSDYCLLKEMSRFPVSQESFRWYCSFNVTNNLCSYFMNVALLDKQVSSLVKKFTTSTSTLSNLLRESRELHICPYEVARLGIADSRIVVTTYHYLLDEASRSVLLSGMNGEPSKMTVVIDEAHNVREFVKGASTLGLSFGDLEQAMKDAQELYLANVGSSLKEIAGRLNTLCSEHTSWYVDKGEFVRSISKGHDEAWLPNLAFELSTCAGAAWQSIAVGRNMPASIIKIGNFLKTLLSSLEMTQFTIVRSDRSFYLVNTDPSQRFTSLVKDYQSLVLLSATINPSELFLRSIGLDKDTRTHKVGPSHTFQVRTLVDVGVSTRYKLRSPEMYSKITRKILAICGCIDGGIGIFVPSYSVLESLEQLLSPDLRGRRVLAEKRGLGNDEADQTMQAFKSTPGSILLAVQGGRFSEGEDFPGDQMDASIVVGLSLPPPSPLMYAEYKQTLFSKHEAYMVISLLPALRKAIQAAGRHMRSPDKRGLVFFLDSRFDDRKIAEMLPGWLKQDLLKGDFEPDQIRQLVHEFQVRGAPL